MSAWVEHLQWFDDGRIAKHLFFKFVVYNMIMRKRALETRTYIIKQNLDTTISQLLNWKRIKNSYKSEILFYDGNLRRTTQY